MGEYKTRISDDAKAFLVMLLLFFVFGMVVGLAVGTVLGVIA